MPKDKPDEVQTAIKVAKMATGEIAKEQKPKKEVVVEVDPLRPLQPA